MSAKEKLRKKKATEDRQPTSKLMFVVPGEWREMLDSITSESTESLAAHCRSVFKAGLEAKGLLPQ